MSRPALILWELIRSNYRLLLSMVLAVAVGYLLEVALLQGVLLESNWRNFALLSLGLAAAVFLTFRWFQDLAAAAQAGVFCHVALEDRSERPVAEDALLRWWVNDTWEHATVMPLAGEVRQSHLERPSGKSPHATRHPFDWDDIVSASSRLNSQMAHSRILAPGAETVSLLVHGRSELMAALGGLVGLEWRGDRHLRLVVDDTGTGSVPFFVFDAAQDTPARSNGDRGESGSEHLVNDKEGWSALLLLKRDATVGDREAAHHQDAAADRQDGVNTATQAAQSDTTSDGASSAGGDFEAAGPKLEGPVSADERQTQAAEEWHVRYTAPIPEDARSYESIARQASCGVAAAAATAQPSAPPRIVVQGQSPVSLVFLTGFLAGRSRLLVGTSVYDKAADSYTPPEWPPDHQSQPPGDISPGDTAAASTDSVAGAPAVPSELSRSRWKWLVGLRAFGLGGVLPFFAGAFALLLEWGVAGSQKELNAGDWLWLLGILSVTLAALLVGGWWVRRELVAPKVTIELSPASVAVAGQTFAHRRITVEAPVVDQAILRDRERTLAAAQSLASDIAAAFADVLTVLPEVRDVTVELGDHPIAYETVHNFNFGLRSALRGNAPVHLRWQETNRQGGPRDCECWSGPGQCKRDSDGVRIQAGTHSESQ